LGEQVRVENGCIVKIDGTKGRMRRRVDDRALVFSGRDFGEEVKCDLSKAVRRMGNRNFHAESFILRRKAASGAPALRKSNAIRATSYPALPILAASAGLSKRYLIAFAKSIGTSG